MSDDWADKEFSTVFDVSEDHNMSIIQRGVVVIKKPIFSWGKFSPPDL